MASKYVSSNQNVFLKKSEKSGGFHEIYGKVELENINANNEKEGSIVNLIGRVTTYYWQFLYYKSFVPLTTSRTKTTPPPPA